MGDAVKAQKQLELLSSLPGGSDCGLLRARLADLEGVSTESDTDVIRDALKKSSTPLQRLELRFFCGCIYETIGNREFSSSYFSEVAKADHQLYIANKAAEKLTNR